MLIANSQITIEKMKSVEVSGFPFPGESGRSKNVGTPQPNQKPIYLRVRNMYLHLWVY